MDIAYVDAKRRMRAPGQRGVAAVEFVLVLGVLLFLLYGMVGFGLLFWMQQKMTHITGDSARYALVASMSGQHHSAGAGCDHAVRHVSSDRMLRMLGPGRVSCTSSAANYTCAHEEMDRCVSITVVADVSQWPVLGVVRRLAGAVGMRDSIAIINQLSATAVVRITGEVES